MKNTIAWPRHAMAGQRQKVVDGKNDKNHVIIEPKIPIGYVGLRKFHMYLKRKVALEWTELEGTYVEAAQNYFAQKSAWFIFTKKVYIAKNVVVF